MRIAKTFALIVALAVLAACTAQRSHNGGTQFTLNAPTRTCIVRGDGFGDPGRDCWYEPQPYNICDDYAYYEKQYVSYQNRRIVVWYVPEHCITEGYVAQKPGVMYLPKRYDGHWSYEHPDPVGINRRYKLQMEPMADGSCKAGWYPYYTDRLCFQADVEGTFSYYDPYRHKYPYRKHYGPYYEHKLHGVPPDKYGSCPAGTAYYDPGANLCVRE